MLRTLTNTKLVHLHDGIEVSYNGNESNPEILFAFDHNDQLIQNLTYACPIYSPKIERILGNSSKIIRITQPCFLYYSSWYQVSFGHYMMQCVPKLKHCIDSDNLIVIPRFSYNNLCRDILDTLNIPSSRLLILDDSITYQFDQIQVQDHNSHYSCYGSHSDQLEIYKKIRQSLKIKERKPKRNVYLKKDGSTNSLFGNSETGIHRKITNEHVLIRTLEDVGFEIITLGEKSLREKQLLLEDIDILVTQLGANCMNLLFSNGPNKIITLSNMTPIAENYYSDLCGMLNGINIQNHVVLSPTSGTDFDPKNKTNNPFEVDTNYVRNLIS